MAQVYAATHRNGRRAAVKVLRPELAVEPVFVERFLREGYLVNKIQHPGAVAILDDDTTPDGAPFLVLELLLGRTLRERVTTTGPLDVDDALHIGVEVLDVLAAAHDHGIVHRDLKPENLFETTEGTIKVLDFGIARLRERAHGGLETLTGTTMGTVGYMPPEQARGQSTEIDARSDLWAVGATLYTLLTGRVLHEAPGTNEGLLEAMTTPVPPMRELAPSLPPPVCSVLDVALSFKKEGRYPGCRAMAEAMVAARGSAGGEGSKRQRRLKLWPWLAFPVGAAIALAVGMWFLPRSSDRVEASPRDSSAAMAPDPTAPSQAPPPIPTVVATTSSASIPTEPIEALPVAPPAHTVWTPRASPKGGGGSHGPPMPASHPA
jgi:eukaryotic-like serine/threonine-protein kinase